MLRRRRRIVSDRHDHRDRRVGRHVRRPRKRNLRHDDVRSHDVDDGGNFVASGGFHHLKGEPVQILNAGSPHGLAAVGDEHGRIAPRQVDVTTAATGQHSSIRPLAGAALVGRHTAEVYSGSKKMAALIGVRRAFPRVPARARDRRIPMVTVGQPSVK